MNRKESGMKQSWPNWGITLATAWRDWGRPQLTSVMIGDVLKEIWTEDLPNVSEECIFCVNNTQMVTTVYNLTPAMESLIFMLPILRLYTSKQQDDRGTEKEVERSSCGLHDILYRHFSGGTAENCEECHKGWCYWKNLNWVPLRYKSIQSYCHVNLLGS